MKEIKVLIVEDNEDWLGDLESNLGTIIAADLAGKEYGGIKIRTAKNQAEADRAVNEAVADGYDLILLDLLYPKGHEPDPNDDETEIFQGMAWLPELRKLQPNATIIILTSFDDPEKVLAAIRDHSANDFIAKTESFDNIIARIRVAWGNTKRLQQIQMLEDEFRSLLRSRATRMYAEDVATLLGRTKNSMYRIAQRIESGDQSAIATAADAIRKEFNSLNSDFVELTNLLREGEERCRPVDVPALVRQMILLYQRMIDNVHAEVVSPSETQSVTLVTFEGDLKVALHEVISNALYALERSRRPPREREVIFIVEEREGGVVIKVMDNGDGFTDEAIAHMFEPGYSTKDGQHQGQGLGLYIAKRMMQQIGGSITARNRPEGGAEVELSVANLVRS